MIQAQTADSLIIEGKIPGLPAGLQVTLLSQEFHHRSEIAKTVSTDGAFRLTGKVASPTLCLLDIENENDPKSIGKEIELMVENGAIAISAAHADSLPPSFTFTTEKLLNACHVNIAGGRVQEEYAEYQRFMLPYLLAAKQAHYNLYIAPEADKRNETDSKPFEKKYKAAEYSADSAQMAFVRLNPDYAISSYLLCTRLERPFVFTDEEIDSFLQLTKNNHDPARLKQLHKLAATGRKFVKGTHYTDFPALDTEKNEHRLSEYLTNGHLLLVDFWASWCGPCRMANPHVRELNRTYAGSLDVCSVSLDQKEEEWYKAMDAEKMEWTQLWLPKHLQQTPTHAYSIQGIPYLLLLSPEGEILYGGHSASEVEKAIRQHTGK